MTISPDGRHLAALVGTDAGRKLAVMSRDRSRARLLRVPDELRAYHWATNERLLLEVGAPHQSPGLAAVNRDGRDYSVLVPPGADAATADGARVLSLLPLEPGRVLISLDGRLPHAPDVHRLDVFSGERSLEAENPGRVFRWLADGRGRVRAAMGWEPTDSGVRYGLWHRHVPHGGRWRRLHEFSPGGPAIVPLAFAADGDGLLVSASVDRDTAAIHRFDPARGSLGPVLFSHAGVDVADLTLGSLGVAMVRWEDQRPGKGLLDEAVLRQDRWLDARLPGLAQRITSASGDGSLAVVFAWSDQVPGRYYLFDREAQTLELIGARRPWLENRLPAREPVRLEARDGWPLQGYLTRPADGRPAPLLLIPHGGPWARDHWGFDAAAQYFAAHGWAVLQVNFRGSTGFGRAHLNAGRGQWDGVMLDDLADGADWAVREGAALRDRICVLGASFGGYAALMSAVRHPERYRCAVSFAAVTDLALRIRTLSADGDGRAFHEWRDMVGDPRREAAGLVRASPLNHARSFRVPVLLAHGGRDRRVAPAHSADMAAALARAKRVHEMLWLPEAGHGLELPADRVRFYERALAFIDRASRTPPPGGG